MREYRGYTVQSLAEFIQEQQRHIATAPHEQEMERMRKRQVNCRIEPLQAAMLEKIAFSLELSKTAAAEEILERAINDAWDLVFPDSPEPAKDEGVQKLISSWAEEKKNVRVR